MPDSQFSIFSPFDLLKPKQSGCFQLKDTSSDDWLKQTQWNDLKMPFWNTEKSSHSHLDRQLYCVPQKSSDLKNPKVGPDEN